VNVPAFAVSYFLKIAAPFLDRYGDSSLYSRLAKGAFWSLAGTVISRGLALLSSIVIARVLGKFEFGELGVIQSTIGMFSVFAGLGMGLTATKYIAEFRKTDAARAGRIIGLSSLVSWGSGGIMSLCLAISSPWLATHTLGAPGLSKPLMMSSLLLLLGSINGAQSGVFAGFEAFKRLAQINSVSGLATFIFMIVGVSLGGVDGAVIGLVLSQAFNCFLNFLGLRKEARDSRVPLGYKDCQREWNVLWKFSLPAVLSGLMIGPVNWICNAILVNQPDGYAQMGIFNAANQWFWVLLFLPSILGQAALPLLSEKHALNDVGETRRILYFSVKLNGLVTLPLVLFGSFASYHIMSFYGRDFADAWPTLVLVLVTAGIIAILTPVGQVLAASGRMWLQGAMNLGWAFCFVLCTWLLIEWGSLGIATARLIAYSVSSIWTFGFVFLVIKKR